MLKYQRGVVMTKDNFIKTIIIKLKKTYKDLSDEEKFFKKSKTMRFYLYKDFLALFAEIITHKEMKTAILNEEENVYFKINPLIYKTFSFIRNLFIHFPIFSYWDEVCFNRELINWNSCGKSIDKYLCNNNRTIGWEIINNTTGKTTRAVIDNMVSDYYYQRNETIFLKDIIDEKSAVRLFITLISEIVYIIDIKLKLGNIEN